jgi:uncharacterized membrane protein YesL
MLEKRYPVLKQYKNIYKRTFISFKLIKILYGTELVCVVYDLQFYLLLLSKVMKLAVVVVECQWSIP